MKQDLEMFKACADATRLRLLILLSERELCVCELVEVQQMPQGKISRHLAVLRQSGLVDDRRHGTWIYYSLRRPDLPLARRLRTYLRAEARESETGRADLERLAELTECGEVCCVREPAPAGRAEAVSG